MADSTTYLLCVANGGYQASLEVRKIYPSLPDAEAGQRGLVRIIDESGEDYLYPASFFVPIDVPQGAQALFAGAV